MGIGTLYRHFPTRDTLIVAVYRRELDLLCDGVDDLLARLPADEALATWMERFISYVARKKGMAAAIKSMVGDNSEIFSQSRARIGDSMSRLLTAAADAPRSSGYCAKTSRHWAWWLSAGPGSRQHRHPPARR